MEIVFTNSDCPTAATRRRLEKRIKAGKARRIYPGTYLLIGERERVSREVEHAARVFAATRRHRHGVVSGVSAAVLHGLPLLRNRIAAPVHVTRECGGRNSEWVVPRRSRLSDHEVVDLHGLRVTSIRRTVEDLATELDAHELLAVADRALSRGVSLAGVGERFRGRKRLEWIEANAIDRSESFAESWSRAIFLTNDVAFPYQQAAIRDLGGDLVARVDFATPDGVLGEFDGKLKYDELLRPGETAADAVMREKRREARLRELGFEIVRWDWDLLHQPEALVRRVETALAKGPQQFRGSVSIEPPKRFRRPDWGPLAALFR